MCVNSQRVVLKIRGSEKQSARRLYEKCKNVEKNKDLNTTPKMTHLPSLKDARTRFRNVLESEIKSGNDVLNYKSIDHDFGTKSNQAAVCVKKLTDYQTKLQ